jgi:hypothetical protein
LYKFHILLIFFRTINRILLKDYIYIYIYIDTHTRFYVHPTFIFKKLYINNIYNHMINIIINNIIITTLDTIIIFFLYFLIQIREENYNNEIYKLGLDILNKGISGHTYKQRAQILIPYFTSSDVESEEHMQIDCQTNAGYLANIMFKDLPSFEEMSICNMGCRPRTKTLPVAQIDCNLLFEKDFKNVINNNIVLKGQKKCYKKDCPGFETTTLSKIGN